jgi:AraC-like DNA-binding protein/mannose-6-phosphate isomerase-like protein (cupin superfamily)
MINPNNFHEIFNNGEMSSGLSIYRHILPLSYGYMPVHWHSEYEINYVASGHITFSVDGKNFALGPGQAVFVNSGSLHALTIPHPGKGVFYSILFSENFIFPAVVDPVYEKYMLPMHRRQKAFPVLLSGSTPWGKQVLNCLAEATKAYFNKSPGNELKARIAFLTLIYQCINNDAFITIDHKHNTKIDMIQSILLYIQNNYTEDIKIKNLAEKANCCPEHFCRTFKLVVGKPPKEFLLDYRLSQASRMLQEEDDSITNIASKCGFSDINYFSRLFKKRNKMTPREYRSAYFNMA